jgi:hypothetical protein
MTVMGPLLLLTILLLLPPPLPPVPAEDDALVALPLMPSVSPLHAGIIHAVEATALMARTNRIDVVLIDITSRKRSIDEESMHRAA